MALDGSLYDTFSGERINRLLRPATLEHALESYPRFVYRLKTNRLQISVATPAEFAPVVRAHVPGHPEERWVMLQADFEKCSAVAKDVVVDLFRTEPLESVLNRIRARLFVEFSSSGG